MGQLPKSGLTELVLMSWNDLGMRVSEGAVVPDILRSPWVIDSSNNTSHTQRNGISLSHLGNKDKHQERSGIEVSDGQFSEEQITTEIGETDFMDGPLSVGRVVVLAAVVLLSESLSVVGEDVCD